MKISTYERLLADIKAAMLDGDTVKRDCLRGLVSNVKDQTVNAGKETTEDIVVSCVKKAAKMREDSIAQFKMAGREDLAAKESKELECLKAYLPKMMGEDELRAVLEGILDGVESPSKKSFGMVMKQLPANADKKMAAAMLGKMLK